MTKAQRPREKTFDFGCSTQPLEENMKFSYGRIFLLGFGFFGVSVLNALYNSYVPNFLQSKFGLSTSVIGFFMALDNIAALFIQPSVGPWSDSLRTKIGRRM